MKNNNELSYKELKVTCNPNIFNFETTADLEPVVSGIGQDRGIEAFEFGVNIDIKGYNIYVEGPSGVGKTMYVKNYLDNISTKKKVPLDWCYIYNFENPNEPVAVSFQAGQGKVFKENMEAFIKDIKSDIKKTFNNDDYEKEKALIRQGYEEKRAVLLEKLNDESIKHGFQVKSSQNGIYMMPVLNGKAIQEEEFEKLDEKIKKEFEDKSNIVQEQIMEAISAIKIIEKEADKKIEDWQSNVALLTVNAHINYLKNQYKKNKKLTTYFNNIKKDILKNISSFVTEGVVDPTKPVQIQKPEVTQPWLNYRVNLLVDNSNLEGAPIVMDSNYLYQNIFGKLEYENYYGGLKTDYTMIKPGLLHLANGGYIIFQAKDLLNNAMSYEALKKTLRIKELLLDNTIEQRAPMVMVSLKPEPIPLDVKVILIGDSNIYHTLLAMDPDFRELFKIKVEFEDEAELNNQNIMKLTRFMHSYCEEENLLHLNKEAVSRVIEYSSRLAGNQEKLSTRFNSLSQIIAEASTWAKLAKSKVITQEFIQKALDKRLERMKKYDEKYLEMIKENTLLIDTEGYKTGEINGLTIMTIGDYTFGKPSKITVNTYMGKSEIINIEREIKMSGATHSKGILILSGYIGELFAQEMPLSLTASICFEQLYSGVDGDSASSTELYALLSSLADVPINQAIAVTGSVNQKGYIQPIGGVNEKIEGYYQICKMRGLTGEHGVIIPKQNVQNLQLSDEIVEDVKKGNFHVYAISTIEEGIEILTGVPAGKKEKSGKFPAGTINYLAYEKLLHWEKIAQKS